MPVIFFISKLDNFDNALPISPPNSLPFTAIIFETALTETAVATPTILPTLLTSAFNIDLVLFKLPKALVLLVLNVIFFPIGYELTTC